MRLSEQGETIELSNYSLIEIEITIHFRSSSFGEDGVRTTVEEELDYARDSTLVRNR